MEIEKGLISEVQTFVEHNYNRGKYFSTHGLVGDYLIKKGYNIRRVDKQLRRKVTTSASQVVRKLLKDKKISKHSTNVYVVRS